MTYSIAPLSVRIQPRDVGHGSHQAWLFGSVCSGGLLGYSAMCPQMIARIIPILEVFFPPEPSERG